MAKGKGKGKGRGRARTTSNDASDSGGEATEPASGGEASEPPAPKPRPRATRKRTRSRRDSDEPAVLYELDAQGNRVVRPVYDGTVQKRRRWKPLAFWKGERRTYEYDDQVNMPVVKGVRSALGVWRLVEPHFRLTFPCAGVPNWCRKPASEFATTQVQDGQEGQSQEGGRQRACSNESNQRSALSKPVHNQAQCTGPTTTSRENVSSE